MAGGLSIDNWMVGWSPEAPDQVQVGPWPDRTGWSQGFELTDGCCDREQREGASLDRKLALLFIAFHTLIVGDGMDPQIVHREFLKIDEYRKRISPDIPGAWRGDELED